jgi:hypothetical protein
LMGIQKHGTDDYFVLCWQLTKNYTRRVTNLS